MRTLALLLLLAGPALAAEPNTLDGWFVKWTSPDPVDGAPPDSLCAVCGDTCRIVQVPCPSNGEIQTLQLCFAPRCPNHGRHVEWLNETWRAKADSIAAMSALSGKPIEPWFPQYGFCDTKRGCIELGLREDGTVVWRRAKESQP
jgi:hypothetical protein